MSQVPFEVLESLSSNKALFNLILENYPNLMLCRSSSVNHVNNIPSMGKDLDIRMSNGDHRPNIPPLVMKMKLKQSKKTNSMDSGVMSPQDSPAISLPLTYTAENSPERQPKAHPPLLRRQFSTTQNSYLKSLPYHRSVDSYTVLIN